MGGVLLLLLGVVVLGMVGFALVGDRIADTMGIRGGDPLNTTEPSGANAISQPENDQPAPPEDTVTPITVGDGGESICTGGSPEGRVKSVLLSFKSRLLT